jgi:hypothetical protein
MLGYGDVGGETIGRENLIDHVFRLKSAQT